MRLLFLLLASVALAINLAGVSLHLPLRVGLGFLVVLVWISLLAYLIFFREDAVSRALEAIRQRERR